MNIRNHNKKSVEDQINDALNFWDCEKQIDFLRDIIPLFELYDVEDESDWVKEAVGEENERNVRLIRTVYLVSKIAESHAGLLASFRLKFPNLYRKMEEFV